MFLVNCLISELGNCFYNFNKCWPHEIRYLQLLEVWTFKCIVVNFFQRWVLYSPEMKIQKALVQLKLICFVASVLNMAILKMQDSCLTSVLLNSILWPWKRKNWSRCSESRLDCCFVWIFFCSFASSMIGLQADASTNRVQIQKTFAICLTKSNSE